MKTVGKAAITVIVAVATFGILVVASIVARLLLGQEPTELELKYEENEED